MLDVLAIKTDDDFGVFIIAKIEIFILFFLWLYFRNCRITST